MSTITGPQTHTSATSISYISSQSFFAAIPELKTIYQKYAEEIEEQFDHSLRIDKWIAKAERRTIKTSHESEEIKGAITDKLIRELASEILVSPYDLDPFIVNTDKRPVLFKGILFPYWMIADILQSMGKNECLQQVTPHHYIVDMLVWLSKLEKPLQIEPSEANSLALASNSLVPSECLSEGFLTKYAFELKIFNLWIYRDRITKAFSEMQMRHQLITAKKALKRVTMRSCEQKSLLESNRAQFHQTIKTSSECLQKQYESISQTRKATVTTMKAHLQDLLNQIDQTRESIRNVQQECQSRQSEINSLQASQRALH